MRVLAKSYAGAGEKMVSEERDRREEEIVGKRQIAMLK